VAKETIPTKFGRRDEAGLLKTATKALSSGFPNPEREGCPDASTIEAIAARRLSSPEIHDLVDHIATCSPCFAAYNVNRKEYCFRRNVRRFTASAAVFTIVTAACYLGLTVLAPALRSPTPVAQVATLTAVLDLHDRTAERSLDAPLPEQREAPHLRRSLLNLQILLPLGSEDGQYSLQFRTNAGGVTAQTTGTAHWNGTNESLSVRIDLRTIEPGRYMLAVRKGDSSWRKYSVFVD
jgi:hypothetical protein